MSKKSLLILIGSVIFLIIVGDIFYLLQNNRLPYVNSSQWVESYFPNLLTFKIATINPDQTVTFPLSLSKIEEVEEKQFLLKKYTILHLRPRSGENQFRDQVYPIQIPSDLKSTGIENIYPQTLTSKKGQIVV